MKKVVKPANAKCTNLVTLKAGMWCVRHAQYYIKCDVCGVWFHAKRSDAKTCSAKCRKAKSRRDKSHSAKSKRTPLPKIEVVGQGSKSVWTKESVDDLDKMMRRIAAKVMSL